MCVLEASKQYDDVLVTWAMFGKSSSELLAVAVKNELSAHSFLKKH